MCYWLQNGFQNSFIRNQCGRASIDVNLKPFNFFFFLNSLYPPHNALCVEAFVRVTVVRVSFPTPFNAYHFLPSPKQKQFSSSLISYENRRTTPSITFFSSCDSHHSFGWAFPDRAQNACHSLEVNDASRNCGFTFVFANEVYAARAETRSTWSDCIPLGMKSLLWRHTCRTVRNWCPLMRPWLSIITITPKVKLHRDCDNEQ